MAATGVSALLIGRAALANPAIFRALKEAANGREGLEGREGADVGASWADVRFRAFQDHLAYLLAFREQLAARFPDDHIPSVDGFASVKMHTHLFRYFAGRPGAAALRARLNAVRTLAEIRQLLARLDLVPSAGDADYGIIRNHV